MFKIINTFVKFLISDIIDVFQVINYIIINHITVGYVLTPSDFLNHYYRLLKIH